MLVALVVLGPDKLPAAARNIAKFYREIRNVTQSVRAQVEEALDLEEGPKRPPGPSGSASDAPTPNPPNPDLSGFRLVDENPPTPPLPRQEDPIATDASSEGVRDHDDEKRS